MRRLVLFVTALLSCGCQIYTDEYNLRISNESGLLITVGKHDSVLDRVTIEKSIDSGSTECLIFGTGKRQSWASYLLEYGTISFYIYEGSIDKKFIYDYDDNNDIALLVQYEFALHDLEMLDWAFSYPPNDDMKDIKMEPPYSSFTDKTRK